MDLSPFSPLAKDRWAYFAKLVNIVVYEILANRELFLEVDWQRLRPFLHIPIDATIMHHLSMVAPDFPVVKRLKGMTKAQYEGVQKAVRVLGVSNEQPLTLYVMTDDADPTPK